MASKGNCRSWSSGLLDAVFCASILTVWLEVCCQSKHYADSMIYYFFEKTQWFVEKDVGNIYDCDMTVLFRERKADLV